MEFLRFLRPPKLFFSLKTLVKGYDFEPRELQEGLRGGKVEKSREKSRQSRKSRKVEKVQESLEKSRKVGKVEEVAKSLEK